MNKPLNSKSNPQIPSLKKQRRFGESLIKSILLLCGVLSIFITIAIVFSLGKEAMLFFTQTQWESTNKNIGSDISIPQSSFNVSTTGSKINPGDVIRISDEIMLVTKVTGDTLKVERGYNDSPIMTHSVGREIEGSFKVTLAKFFLTTEWNPQIGKFGI
ncbi:MAG: hypothetical protein N2D54_12285, partial [Chloroflexota bacterium]